MIMPVDLLRHTVFVIINQTEVCYTLVDFIKENLYIVDKILGDIDIDMREEHYKLVIEECRKKNVVLKPHKLNRVVTTEYADSLEWIIDYGLRDGGQTEKFKWCFVKFVD